MNMRRQKFLLLATLAAAAAASGLGQAAAPTASSTNGAPSIPSFSGVWAHTSITGYEPLASGPTSLKNLSRRGITSDNRQLVGDYSNPILKPEAADIVKKHGEMSLAGIGYPTPRNQCWPGGVPFVFTTTGIQILQQLNEIIFLYYKDHAVLVWGFRRTFRRRRPGDRHRGDQGRALCHGRLVRHAAHARAARGRALSAARLRTRERRIGEGREREFPGPAEHHRSQLQGQAPAARVHGRG